MCFHVAAIKNRPLGIPRDMYPSLRYIQDICRIHRDTFEDTYFEPYLRPGCILSLDGFEIHVSDHHVSRMYPACILITLADTCILHVSRMYPASQIRTSQDTFEIQVSQYVSWKYPTCIPYVSSNLCRYMYPACIPHVSFMYVSHVRSSLQVCLPCNSYRGAQRR